jgi:hypothetical protein
MDGDPAGSRSPSLDPGSVQRGTVIPMSVRADDLRLIQESKCLRANAWTIGACRLRTS